MDLQNIINLNHTPAVSLHESEIDFLDCVDYYLIACSEKYCKHYSILLVHRQL